MIVFLRHIHKVSQNPINDTTGPFEIKVSEESADLADIWRQIKRYCAGRKSGVVPARKERGGFVFFFSRSDCYHSVLVCPVDSDLYLEYVKR